MDFSPEMPLLALKLRAIIFSIINPEWPGQLSLSKTTYFKLSFFLPWIKNVVSSMDQALVNKTENSDSNHSLTDFGEEKEEGEWGF